MREGTRQDFARDLRKALTPAETCLWLHLRCHQLGGFRFRRQHPVGPCITDFACVERKLIVELDGSQHLDSAHDETRDAYLRGEGFCVLRFWNDDALLRTDEVLSAILAALSGSET